MTAKLAVFLFLSLLLVRVFWPKRPYKYNNRSLKSWHKVSKGIVLLRFKNGKKFSGRQYEWVTYPFGGSVPDNVSNQLRIVWYSVYCGEIDDKLDKERFTL